MQYFIRRLNLILLAVSALTTATGLVCLYAGSLESARWLWLAGSLPVLSALVVSMVVAVRRREFGLDILAVIAIGLSMMLGELLTASVIALMLASGRALEDYARTRARADMTALLRHAPRTAIRLDDNQWRSIALDSVVAGDRLLVRHGEVVPADGTLTSTAELDESTLTGEAHACVRSAGEAICSGVVNTGPPFEMIVSATAAQSTFAAVVRMVESAQRARSPAARLADRYAIGFVTLTLLMASGAGWFSGSIGRALAVLVVATPCPLILAVPIAIVAGISRCARRGVLIKEGGALERLAVAQTLFLDKTGTLTGGQARLVSIETAPGDSPERVLRIAASLAQASNHVISSALAMQARARGLVLGIPNDVHETPGSGVSGIVDGHAVSIGSFDFVRASASDEAWSAAVLRRSAYEGETVVFVSENGVMAGAIRMADRPRVDTPRAIRLLRRAGVSRIVMLTGDRADIARTMGAILQVDAVLARQTPADKLAAIESARRHGTVVMVGDGVNDAPALAAADVGVAMGAGGAAASSEAADIVLLVDRLDRLAEARRIAACARRIATESALVGMGLSIVAMGFAASGFLPPIAGAILQEFIDVAAIANSLRVLLVPTNAAGGVLPPATAMRLRTEHTRLDPVIRQIQELADELPGLSPATIKLKLTKLTNQLNSQLVPHEAHDDRQVYPQLEALLGGDDPLAAMSSTHREIFRMIQTLTHMVDDMPSAGPDPGWTRDLECLLYSLHAIVHLHCAQEEELIHALEGQA